MPADEASGGGARCRAGTIDGPGLGKPSMGGPGKPSMGGPGACTFSDGDIGAGKLIKGGTLRSIDFEEPAPMHALCRTSIIGGPGACILGDGGTGAGKLSKGDPGACTLSIDSEEPVPMHALMIIQVHSDVHATAVALPIAR